MQVLQVLRTPVIVRIRGGQWGRRCLAVGALLGAIACHRQTDPQTPLPSAFFVPAGARNVDYRQAPEVEQVVYQIDAAYPASPFLCELTGHLQTQQWRGLRQDPLNPEIVSDLIRGWHDFTDISRPPERRVHAWMASWRNADGDLLTYSLRYEYPVNTTPALSTLTVAANLARAKAVRVMSAGRDLLQAPVLPAPPVTMKNLPCATTPWNDFVKNISPKSTPVAALPTELAGIDAIQIQRDIDGLGERIARALREQVPTLHVGTPLHPLPTSTDAALDLTFDYRCDIGKPTVFYVREAVLYKLPTAAPWVDPARVLFYWSNGGAAPTSDQADRAFVASLASSILAFRDRQIH